jgi:hypothetical protein
MLFRWCWVYYYLVGQQRLVLKVGSLKKLELEVVGY